MDNFDQFLNSGIYNFGTIESSPEEFQKFVDYVNSMSYDDAKKFVSQFNTLNEGYDSSVKVVLGNGTVESIQASNPFPTTPEFVQGPKSYSTATNSVADSLVEKIQNGVPLTQNELSTFTKDFVIADGFHNDLNGNSNYTYDICTPEGDVLYSFPVSSFESDSLEQIRNLQKGSMIGVSRSDAMYFGSDKKTYTYDFTPPGSKSPITITSDKPISAVEDIINKYHDWSDPKNVSVGGNHRGLNSPEEYQQYLKDLDSAISKAVEDGEITQEAGDEYFKLRSDVDATVYGDYEKFAYGNGIVPSSSTDYYGDYLSTNATISESNYSNIDLFVNNILPSDDGYTFDYKKFVDFANDGLIKFDLGARENFETQIGYLSNPNYTADLISKNCSMENIKLNFTADELNLFQIGGVNLGKIVDDFNGTVSAAVSALDSFPSEIDAARSAIVAEKARIIAERAAAAEKSSAKKQTVTEN